MILDTSPTTPMWHTDSVAPVQFSTVVAGRSILAEPDPTLKYEWQWAWYIEGD